MFCYQKYIQVKSWYRPILIHLQIKLQTNLDSLYWWKNSWMAYFLSILYCPCTIHCAIIWACLYAYYSRMHIVWFKCLCRGWHSSMPLCRPLDIFYQYTRYSCILMLMIFILSTQSPISSTYWDNIRKRNLIKIRYLLMLIPQLYSHGPQNFLNI